MRKDLALAIEENAGRLVAVTDRELCRGKIAERVEKLAKLGIRAIILRDKASSEQEYLKLAEKAISVCENSGTELILHGRADAARQLGWKKIHLPLLALEASEGTLEGFETIGASCHSVSDALLAKKLGATYITASHIFETDCKKGLKGRGLGFLEEVCSKAELPVWALGGISPANYKMCLERGAEAACMMSVFMTARLP